MMIDSNYKKTLLLVIMVFGVRLSLIQIILHQQNPSPAISAGHPSYKPGTVLVRFNNQVSRNTLMNVLQNVKAVQKGTVYGSDVHILHVALGDELEVIDRLLEFPEVLYAEPDYRYTITAVPDDPFYGAQWAHTKLHSDQAWDITTGSTSIKIAIIDTGIDNSHPDLAPNILQGQSFLNQGQQDANPIDLHGHGTHVAGIAAAVADNNAGVAGMSWGAKIIPVRVLDAMGDGWTTDIASGINWARLQGADIVNLSVGGEAESATMRVAIDQAHQAGILVVASMGNDQLNTPYYPAAYPHVLAVTATTIDNHWASYANYGPHTDIAAPGGTMTQVHDSNGILSTLPTYPVYLTTNEGYSTYYDMMYGTSQAAPFISGLAALVWSLDSSLSSDAVSNIITSTAVDLGVTGWDQYFGHGLADAKAALDMVNLLENSPVLYAIDNIDLDGNYFVQWTAVDKATSYLLEVSDNPGFGMPSLLYDGAGLEYHVVGQPAGKWYYRVKARNASGDSPWSQTVYAEVMPDAPVLFSIINSSEPDAYTLSWSSVYGAEAYILHQSSDMTFTSPVTRYIGSDIQHYITGQPGGMWSYRVSAFNNVGASVWSNIQSKTVPTPSLEAPTLLPIENADGDGSYIIQWTIVPSTTIYALEESNSLYFHNKSLVYAGPSATQAISDHIEGTWYYRVRGYNATGSSPWSVIRNTVVVSNIYIPLILRNYVAPEPSSYLSNGDFEAGDIGWVQYSLRGYPLIVNKTFAGMKEPYNGDWAVWMGGDFNEIAFIQQEILIYASAPYLSYWHWIETAETDCGADYASIIVNADTVDSLDLCDVHNTGGWVQRSVDLGAYTGGKATFVLRVVTDGEYNSNYFVDNFSFDTSPVTTFSDRPIYDQLTIPLRKP